MPRKMPTGMIKRGKMYYAQFGAGGRLVRKRLSSDFTVAVQLLNELKARADRADFGLLDNNYPWASLKAEFIRWRRQTSRTASECENDLNQFETYRRVRTIRQIDHGYIHGFRDWRLASGVCPRTVNKQVGTLRSMLNKAVQWGKIGSNPIAGIKPLPHDTPTKVRRSLTHEELEALFAASPEYLRPVWRAFACTGLRKEELVELRFADFDDNGPTGPTVTVRAEVAKNHRAREIPLDHDLFTTILRLRDEAKNRQTVKGWTPKHTELQAANFSRDHIFVTNANTPFRNNLLTRFYMCCRRAGIVDAVPGGSVDIHSLRVSFTTLIIEGGASPKDVQAILGHSTLNMTMGIYAKVSERSKRNAISCLPFATASQPRHTVSLPEVHKSYASNPSEAQAVVA
jgi:integrase